MGFDMQADTTGQAGVVLAPVLSVATAHRERSAACDRAVGMQLRRKVEDDADSVGR